MYIQQLKNFLTFYLAKYTVNILGFITRIFTGTTNDLFKTISQLTTRNADFFLPRLVARDVVTCPKGRLNTNTSHNNTSYYTIHVWLTICPIWHCSSTLTPRCPWFAMFYHINRHLPLVNHVLSY